MNVKENKGGTWEGFEGRRRKKGEMIQLKKLKKKNNF